MIIYNIRAYLLYLYYLILLLWRGLFNSEYFNNIQHRFGYVPSRIDRPLIFHACSLGEMITATRFIKGLQKALPQYPLVITTNTLAGYKVALPLANEHTTVFYLAFDLPWAMKRFIARFNPAVVIITEAEWLINLAMACKRCDIPIFGVNSLLFTGKDSQLLRYSMFRDVADVFIQASALIILQNPDDTEYFNHFNVAKEKIKVGGNFKLDIDLSNELKDKACGLKKPISDRVVLIAGSTHEKEEELILSVFTKLRAVDPRLLLVIAPRHHRRFAEVADLCRQKGFKIALRTESQTIPAVDILVLDTLGELLIFYGIADIAIVGGSFVPIGGHNVLEAAVWEIPVIIGPHYFNFKPIVSLLQQSHGLVIANGGEALFTTIEKLLKNRDDRIRLGNELKTIIDQNCGAVQKNLDLIIPRVAEILNKPLKYG